MHTFATYIHGVRSGRPSASLATIAKYLSRLASAPQADLDDLYGAEVRVTDARGVERLYAVVSQDRSGNLHLRTKDGDDTLIPVQH